MPNRTGIIALAMSVVVVGLAGWLLTGSVDMGRRPVQVAPRPTPTVAASEIDIEELQQIAINSCKCARSGGGSEDECWADYRARTTAFYENSIVTDCETSPLSPSTECVQTTAGEKCVDVNYGAAHICTPEEANAAEHAWFSAPDGKQQAAIQDVMARIMRGEKVTAPPAPDRCA